MQARVQARELKHLRISLLGDHALVRPMVHSIRGDGVASTEVNLVCEGLALVGVWIRSCDAIVVAQEGEEVTAQLTQSCVAVVTATPAPQVLDTGLVKPVVLIEIWEDLNARSANRDGVCSIGNPVEGDIRGWERDFLVVLGFDAQICRVCRRVLIDLRGIAPEFPTSIGHTTVHVGSCGATVTQKFALHSAIDVEGGDIRVLATNRPRLDWASSKVLHLQVSCVLGAGHSEVLEVVRA
mmetsp:Transcript_12558/g.29542  ORF Transcript_12558/g.29542 Transcript_12558/m.29542 type:complete len:239 (+) Transcript_12558:679-1395(+)